MTHSRQQRHKARTAPLLKPEDLEIETYRPTGIGALTTSVRDMNSAIRITHKPTGIAVVVQEFRSLLQNREEALRQLRAKLGYEQGGTVFSDEELARIEQAALFAAGAERSKGGSSGHEREADALEKLARKARQQRQPFVGDNDHEKDDRIL